jgi:hypothetical protein
VNNPTYSIRSSWTKDTQTPAVVGQRLVTTIDRLNQIEPAIDQWWILEDSTSELIPFDDVRPTIAQFVEANVGRDSLDDPYPSYGYGCTLGGSSEPLKTPPVASLRINNGSSWNNLIDFGIGRRPPDYSLVTFAAYRGAIEVFASEWPCPWLVADGFDYDPNAPYTPFQDAWIAYLSPALSAGLTPSAELGVERTPGGGLILGATEDRFDPSNADHRRRSQVLRTILLDRLGPLYNTDGRQAARTGPY